MKTSDWYYDDKIQVGLDFGDQTEVRNYDDRQTDRVEDDRALLATLKLKSTDIVADIGCGTGLFACEAAKQAEFVVAVDISEPMLAETRARALRAGLKNLRTEHAGFLSWDAAGGPFDLITSKFALHHLPDFWKAAALRRLHDALKPGGRLFLRDVVFSCAPDEIPSTVENWIAWMGENTGYSRAEVACHIRDEHSTFGWIMEGLLASAGFRIIKSDYDSGKIYADYLLIKPRQAASADVFNGAPDDIAGGENSEAA